MRRVPGEVAWVARERTCSTPAGVTGAACDRRVRVRNIGTCPCLRRPLTASRHPSTLCPTLVRAALRRRPDRHGPRPADGFHLRGLERGASPLLISPRPPSLSISILLSRCCCCCCCLLPPPHRICACAPAATRVAVSLSAAGDASRSTPASLAASPCPSSPRTRRSTSAWLRPRGGTRTTRPTPRLPGPCSSTTTLAPSTSRKLTPAIPSTSTCCHA